MTVIAVGSIKGGGGKSTVATNLAVALLQDKFKVLLIDLDLQGSSLLFADLRPKEALRLECHHAPDISFLDKLRDIPSEVIVILDVPAKDTPVSRAAFVSAHKVIVPVRPGQYDLAGAEKTFKLFDYMAKAKKTRIQFGVVLNQVNSRANLSIDAEQMIRQIVAEYKGGHLFKTQLNNRITYQETASNGLGVVEGGNTKAKLEFLSFYKEVKRWS